AARGAGAGRRDTPGSAWVAACLTGGLDLPGRRAGLATSVTSVIGSSAFAASRSTIVLRGVGFAGAAGAAGPGRAPRPSAGGWPVLRRPGPVRPDLRVRPPGNLRSSGMPATGEPEPEPGRGWPPDWASAGGRGCWVGARPTAGMPPVLRLRPVLGGPS